MQLKKPELTSFIDLSVLDNEFFVGILNNILAVKNLNNGT